LLWLNFREWIEEGGARILSLDTNQKREHCENKSPLYNEHLAWSIVALGTSGSSHYLPLDGMSIRDSRLQQPCDKLPRHSSFSLALYEYRWCRAMDLWSDL